MNSKHFEYNGTNVLGIGEIPMYIVEKGTPYLIKEPSQDNKGFTYIPPKCYIHLTDIQAGDK